MGKVVTVNPLCKATKTTKKKKRRVRKRNLLKRKSISKRTSLPKGNQIIKGRRRKVKGKEYKGNTRKANFTSSAHI